MFISQISQQPFQANVKFPKPQDAKHLSIKKILPELSACGRENVTHEIKTSDDNNMLAMVLTTFRVPEKHAFQVFKRLDFEDNESVMKKIDELKTWVKDRVIQSKM